tara:strand:+ start:288 stop:476 length:189 start_codon:yes stop_codon:yes gene_type:complete
MNNWREYEAIEEESHTETSQKITHKIKKKKTWKQITEVKNNREHSKKQWQKKRRVSKNTGDK